MTGVELLNKRVVLDGIELGRVVDVCAARPAAAPVDQRLDPLVLAFEDRLDRAVGRVPHPAADAQRAGTVPRLDPEEDALHGSVHDDMGALHYADSALARFAPRLRRGASHFSPGGEKFTS